ncbi:MAG: phosphatase [Verrucomicrobiales bacterium]|nr:phosphatase [Verrucomicrobiales bacterium]|tara:strand:- start:1609 stop:2958 length:1350 start_codon:yes stop_codon:yes gene_type:complete
MSTRRRFLHDSAAVALGFGGLQILSARLADKDSLLTEGYGPLRPDPAKVLDLPKGFSYRIISRAGDQMDDGLMLPGKPDGMAAFAGPKGTTILVRNHEISAAVNPEAGPFGKGNAKLTDAIRAKMYDVGARLNVGRRVACLGGTTTLVYDTKQQKVLRQFLSLTGTLRNCAGGLTPWGSWVTCEETTERAGKTCSLDHGYNFEVPATAEPALAKAVPLKAMGRFNHEAIAVDPKTGYVFETEDRGDGLLYRFIPAVRGQLVKGGKLQALVVRDAFALDTRNWDKQRIQVGGKLRVQWLDLEDVESSKDDLRHRGAKQGAARFARGEGMWYSEGSIYFACTNGGAGRHGQIWKLTGDTLELFAQPNDKDLCDNADNLTVAPWGDVILCEDGGGDQYIVGITPEGRYFKLAHNASGNSEFAGATFSPDGTTLFVNIQHRGLTLAITGPWQG